MNERSLIESGAAKILSLAEETKYAANGIVSRTLLRTADTRTVLFGFAEGQELTEHTSTHHALIQILSGECEFSIAGDPQNLKTGNFLYLPPGMPHAVKATTQFSMLLTLTRPAVAERFEVLATETKIQTQKMKNQISLNRKRSSTGARFPVPSNTD